MNDYNSDELRRKLRNFTFHDLWFVPEALHDGIVGYVCYGYRPGGFLSAVLCNDLSRAFASADDHNIAMMPAIVSFLHNNVPAVCWGSPQAFEAWLGTNGARIRVLAKRKEQTNVDKD